MEEERVTITTTITGLGQIIEMEVIVDKITTEIITALKVGFQEAMMDQISHL